jgi:hypothetical protein
MYVFAYAVRSSTPDADHAAEGMLTPVVTLPAEATVLSTSAPATPDDPVLPALRRLPVPEVGVALPAAAISLTIQSFESPVVMLKLGVVLEPVFVPVIPMHVTPEYSATFTTYSVLAENVGVTFVSAAQSIQTATAEHASVPLQP